MRVLKYGCHNLASPLLSFWFLWTAFSSCCPLSWRYFCFRCVMVDPCFIYCHISTQKILFTSLEQLQTALWMLDALLFLVRCKQTRDPLRKQLTHPQRFVQNCKHTTFWYLLGVSYLTQLSCSIAQNCFVDICYVFRTTADFGRPERPASSVFDRPPALPDIRSEIMDSGC